MPLFSDFDLNPALLTRLNQLGHHEPTPIQSKTIPLILNGRDVMAAAQTGTGKTAAFALPLLHRLMSSEQTGSLLPRALILVPTRELAEQVLQSLQSYSRLLPLRSYAAYGGSSISPQITALHEGIDILVATPGRLLDLYRHDAVTFRGLKYLVVDEADRMLDAGFATELDDILCAIPRQRQTLLFSATFSQPVKETAAKVLQDPVSVEASAPNSSADTLTQWLIPVDKKRKTQVLQQLLGHKSGQQALIFVNTRHSVDQLEAGLHSAGFSVAGIHGEKTQANRTSVMQAFRRGDIQYLIATDVAARGLDIPYLPQVINLALPLNAEDYIHRIGRSGRNGRDGEAVSLVCADEVHQLAKIEQLSGQLLERRPMPGYEPTHKVPLTAVGGTVLTKAEKTLSKPRPARSPSAKGPRLFDHSEDGQRRPDRRRRRKK
ncbi:MAG: DEAD/DEAH box helicase [Oceanospirillaceae bacterium]|nr:DEAD/DEAH box helicase [Oceanospirillaceae bacterium]MBT13920.1 DEAD/DEAH box helicase [Oceanospirillaceae bacterium]